jgi:superkiller protein 3
MGYARTRRRSGGNGLAAFLVLLVAVVGGMYLLLQMRLGTGPNLLEPNATATLTPVLTPTRSFSDFVELAETAETGGQYRKAIEYLDQASRRKPNDPLLHARVARLLVYLNEPAKAEQRARKALSYDAQSAYSLAVLCLAVEWQNRLDEAITACESAIQLDAKLPEAHAFLAEAYADKEDLAAARKSGELALDLAPNNVDALRVLGYVNFVFGRYDTALTYYRRALDVNPNLPQVRVAMSSIFINYAIASGDAASIYGNADAAIRTLTPTLELDNKNALAYERLGEAYRIRGEFEKSDIAFENALKLEPKRISVYTKRGVLRFQRGFFPGSVEDYTRAISLSREISDTISVIDYSFLAYAQQRSGECAGARQALADALTAYPENEYLGRVSVEIERNCQGR